MLRHNIGGYWIAEYKYDDWNFYLFFQKYDVIGYDSIIGYFKRIPNCDCSL